MRRAGTRRRCATTGARRPARLRRGAAGRRAQWRAGHRRDRLSHERHEVGRGSAPIQRDRRPAREPADRRVAALRLRPRGAAFIDRALYLPDEWMGAAARREEAHIPEQVGFATKGALARELVARAFAAGVPARWVVGDTVDSGDELRRWLEGQGHRYVLAVPETHGIWPGPVPTSRRRSGW